MDPPCGVRVLFGVCSHFVNVDTKGTRGTWGAWVQGGWLFSAMSGQVGLGLGGGPWVGADHWGWRVCPVLGVLFVYIL